MFPSPCGVMCFLTPPRKSGMLSSEMFPSPCGVMCFLTLSLGSLENTGLISRFAAEKSKTYFTTHFSYPQMAQTQYFRASGQNREKVSAKNWNGFSSGFSAMTWILTREILMKLYYIRMLMSKGKMLFLTLSAGTGCRTRCCPDPASSMTLMDSLWEDGANHPHTWFRTILSWRRYGQGFTAVDFCRTVFLVKSVFAC